MFVIIKQVLLYVIFGTYRNVLYDIWYLQECFTRVLKGHINLCAAVFPNGVKGNANMRFNRHRNISFEHCSYL